MGAHYLNAVYVAILFDIQLPVVDAAIGAAAEDSLATLLVPNGDDYKSLNPILMASEDPFNYRHLLRAHFSALALHAPKQRTASLELSPVATDAERCSH